MNFRAIRIAPMLLLALWMGCTRSRDLPERPAPTRPVAKSARSGRVNVVTTQGNDERLAIAPFDEAAADAAEGQPLSTLLAVKAKAAPKLDGVLEDACWKEAKPTDEFQQSSALPAAARKWVVARAAFDDEAIYLGVTLAKPGPILRANETKAGGRVWLDDALEIFLVHPERKILCQVDVNALGTVFAEPIPDR